MIPRHLLATLVFGLPILVVSLAVIACGALLAERLGDTAGARGLLWIAIGALLALVIDVVLLVGVLGLMALDRHQNDDEGS